MANWSGFAICKPRFVYRDFYTSSPLTGCRAKYVLEEDKADDQPAARKKMAWPSYFSSGCVLCHLLPNILVQSNDVPRGLSSRDGYRPQISENPDSPKSAALHWSSTNSPDIGSESLCWLLPPPLYSPPECPSFATSARPPPLYSLFQHPPCPHYPQSSPLGQ